MRLGRLSLAAFIALAVSLSEAHDGGDCRPFSRDLKTYMMVAPRKIGPTGRASPEVRSLVWKLWRERRSAELILYRSTKEGMPFTEQLWFERDPNGEWSVQVVLFRETWSVKGQPAACYRSYRVIRYLTNKQGEILKEMDEGDTRPASVYRLRMVTKDGAELSAL